MKKKQRRPRKLRKCERGIKTKNKNKGCRYQLGYDGRFYPLQSWTK